jgi:hypothetical protein
MNGTQIRTGCVLRGAAIGADEALLAAGAAIGAVSFWSFSRRLNGIYIGGEPSVEVQLSVPQQKELARYWEHINRADAEKHQL